MRRIFYNSQILDKKKIASSKALVAKKLRDSKNLWRSVRSVWLSHTILFSINAPLCGIKNITEYKEYIFSIFVNILDDIEDGALKEKGMARCSRVRQSFAALWG